MHFTKKNIFFINILYNFIKKNHIKEIPIGSLIIENNKILSCKKNSIEKNDFLDHAECLVIKDILKKKINPSNCILFTSLEPCLMCTGAAINANIKMIYYLCKSDFGIHTKYNITCIPKLAIIPLLLYEEKIIFLIKSFFKNKRKE